MADLKTMKGVSDKDRKLIEEAEAMIGPEPDSMGLVKNMFWGNIREDLLFPFPEIDPEETALQPQRPASTAGAGLWANFTEKEISSSPLMSVFVLEQTRPLVMAMSGVTILAALILLGRSGRFT